MIQLNSRYYLYKKRHPPTFGHILKNMQKVGGVIL